jgi:hypothetical protein
LKDKFILSICADYSALTQTTNVASFYYPGVSNTGVYDYDVTVSNRFNLFLAPGYAIDKNKLA